MKNRQTYVNGVLKNKLKIRDYNELHLIIRDTIDKNIEKFMLENDFELSTNYIRNIHYELYKSIYFFAGYFRNINITKKEPFLLGYELGFTDYKQIEKELFIFPQSYELQGDKMIKQIVEKVSVLWKTHPFRAGNTITCIVFVCKYVEKTYGYNIYEEIKKDYTRFYVALILVSIENNDVELFLFLKEIIDNYEKKLMNLRVPLLFFN